jgi:pilus assembly protein Flp/PilA
MTVTRAKNTAALFMQDKRAVTAVEYALIAALIAVVIIGVVTTLGGNISSTFGTVASEL